MTLFEPPDVDAASRAWNANCGPCALAAVLRQPVTAVRHLFPTYPKRAWCNPTGMLTALDQRRTPRRKVYGQLPQYGLAFLQIEGPWEAPGVPITVAYRHTHWIGHAIIQSGPDAGTWVYDVNGAQWTPLQWWRENVMSAILAHVPKSTGWRMRMGIEVAL